MSNPSLVVHREVFENGILRTVKINGRQYIVSETEVGQVYDFMRKIDAEDLSPNDLHLRMLAWLESFEAGIQKTRLGMAAPFQA